MFLNSDWCLNPIIYLKFDMRRSLTIEGQIFNSSTR